MGLMTTLAKFGVAKKAFDMARRPENQQRIMAMIASAKDRRRGSKG
jgi:hypothetical protein